MLPLMARQGFKVGIAQPAVVIGDKAANVAALRAAVAEAGRSRCDAVVLPECGLAGWLSPLARTAAEPIPGPFTRSLCALARKFGMSIAAGLEERADGRIYNSAVLIDRTGRIRPITASSTSCRWAWRSTGAAIGWGWRRSTA